MNAQLSKNSIWRDKTDGLRHEVIEISSEGIVTWSDPLSQQEESASELGGFSWFGPLSEFLEQFIFVCTHRPKAS